MKKLVVLLLFVAAGYKLYDMNFSETEVLPFYIESEKFAFSASFPKKPEYRYKEVDHPDFGPIGIEVYGVKKNGAIYTVQGIKYLAEDFDAPDTLEEAVEAFNQSIEDKYDLIKTEFTSVNSVPAVLLMHEERRADNKSKVLITLKDGLSVQMMVFYEPESALVADKYIESLQIIN